MDLNQPRECAVFGIDVGKNVFHVVGHVSRWGDRIYSKRPVFCYIARSVGAP